MPQSTSRIRASLTGRRSRGLRVAAALILAASLAAACGGGSDSGAGAPQGTVRIGLSGGFLSNYAVHIAALGSGSVDEVAGRNNVKIEHQSFSSTPDTLAALSGGSVDMAALSSSALANAVSSGRDLVAVFNWFEGGGIVFVGAKSLEQSHGTDLKNYAGDTWAYVKEGSITNVLMQLAATGAGLNWATMKTVATGSASAYLPTLQSGRAQIVAMDPTAASKAVDQGLGYVVYNTSEPAQVEKVWGRIIGSPLITTRKFLDSHQQFVQDLVGAEADALRKVQSAQNDPQAILNLFPQEQRKALSDGWNSQWEMIKPAIVNLDGSFTPRSVQDSLVFAEKSGLLKPEERTKLAADPTFFDNVFVDAAKKPAS